ncbi:MAG: transcriptional regulator KorA [Candidatus Eremiobacteraeota bacterium]|nr:transcriptional regulator KorA [Candidatus Eremiobacteraeota bacterium]
MPLLTEQEWKRLLPLLANVKVERRQTAYNRLVNGMTLAKAGEAYGYSRQDVRVLANAVLRKQARLNSMPEPAAVPRGWIRMEFVVPRRHVDDVRRVIEALYPQPLKPKTPKEKEPALMRSRPAA